MAKISTQQKLQNYNDLKSYIIETGKKKSRYPTLKEMMEFSKMSERTVRRYKSSILNEIKESIRAKYTEDLAIDVDKLLEVIDENIEIFKTIRDESKSNNDDKTNAANNLRDTRIAKITLKKDSMKFLILNKDDQFGKGSLHREDENQSITAGFESINN